MRNRPASSRGRRSRSFTSCLRRGFCRLVIFSGATKKRSPRNTRMTRKKNRFVFGHFVCFVCFVVKPKKFNAHPFAYHQEIELEITTLTNLGIGLGRVARPAIENQESKLEKTAGWVVMVPFALPGERVRARVFRNHRNYP